jgi:putative transposase
MSGVSEDGSLQIGNKVNDIISKSIKRLDKINNNDIKNKIKKKNELMINRKISNRVDDLHWKSIKYLTQNYKTILIGDMSAKDIVKKNSSVLNKYQKVACLRTKYYEFTQRLQFKCLINNVNYNLINESYTSKVCSSCGSYKKDLGGAKIYYCKDCQMSIDRDINGARNIYIKSIM